jgi:hypothetical protein
MLVAGVVVILLTISGQNISEDSTRARNTEIKTHIRVTGTGMFSPAAGSLPVRADIDMPAKTLDGASSGASHNTIAILQALKDILGGMKHDDLDARTRTFLRQYTTSAVAKTKSKAASNNCTKRRYAEDPDFRQKANERSAEFHKNRYGEDEVYRERVKAERRARYHRQKETALAAPIIS